MQRQRRQQSQTMTVTGDLDGRTVAEIREMLSQFPDDAIVESYTETIMGIDEPEEFEFFHIVWEQTS